MTRSDTLVNGGGPRRLIADAIRSVADPEAIILFGSDARGEASAGSDLDVLVVEARSRWRGRSRRQESGRLRRSIPPLGRPIDVLLVTPEEVERWRDAQNHVICIALREGVVLHERP